MSTPIVGPAMAQDATWLANPTVAGPTAGTFDFNGDANWTPATTPTGTASFGTSAGNTISFSNPVTTLGGMTFNAGALELRLHARQRPHLQRRRQAAITKRRNLLLTKRN